MTVFQCGERSLWAAFFVAFLFSHTAFGQSLQFDIEPDRLDRVLVKFSEQSDIQHLYTDPQISTMPSAGVMGRFSPEEALQHLLAGTDVHYRFTSDATVHIYIPEASETRMATEASEGNDAGAAMSAERAEPPGTAEGTSNSPESAGTPSLPTMDEITVTARKREERLQDVPVSVTAISGDFIADAGLTSIRDIADFTPNFSFRESFGRTFDRPVIRGMSNILGGANTGIFIDGIFVSGSISATELSNVERVEIIKGPQAALYGRATFAGAVNYITRTPTDELKSDVTLSFAEYGERELYGSVSGPLVDGQLYYLLSARHYTYDGHYRNEGTGGGRAGGEESSSLSGALFWTPTDRLNITLRAAYSEDDDDHIAFRLQPSQFNNCFPDAPLGYFCGPVQRFDAVELNLDVLPDPGLQRDTSRFSLSADLDVGAVTLTSVSSYTRERTRIQRDNDFLDTNNNPLIFLPFLSVEAFRTFDRSNLYDLSQELRVSSDPAQRLRWLTGVYLYRERESGESGSGVNLSETTPTAPRRVTNRAAYGAVEFDITDQFTATAEIRHARDRIQTVSRSTANGEERVVDLSNTFVSTTPRATLRYAFSDSLMAYASVARGNKPGGFNTALQAADILPEERERLGEFRTFDEEKAWNYEVGIKGSALENALTWDVSVFYIDWTRQQLTTSEAIARTGSPFSTIGLIVNAGETEVKGLEAQLNLRALDWWDIGLSYGLANAKFKQFDDAEQEDLFGDPSARGFRTPNAPQHTGAAWTVMRFPVSLETSGSFRLDFLYESTRYAQIHNLAETEVSRKVNARISLYNGPWTLTAFGRNLTDNRTPNSVTRFLDPNTLFADRAFGAALPRGRQLGMRLNYAFR